MTRKKEMWLRAAIVLGGIVFIAIGASRGEVFTVFMKATKICMECIGIG